MTRLSKIVQVLLILCVGFGAACNSPAQQPTSTPTVTIKPTVKPTSKPKVASGPYNQQADPKKDIEAALAKAKTDNKQILLDFGANWCPDCIVLSKIFEDATVKPFLEDHFHVVQIDVGYWDKNLDVAKQYGNPIEKGIPAVVVLDSKGSLVATTKEGELANARTATKADILAYLQQWAAEKP